MSCDSILDRILAPKQWERDGVIYRRKVSSQPATGSDVKRLEAKLNAGLEQLKAREVGLCPIKRRLYDQCFNEIIRQVTLNCAERGHVLLMIRDEINMTVESYRGLYESVIGHGIRKVLLKEHKRYDLEKAVEELRTGNARLRAELAETTEATARAERASAEARDAEAALRADELNALKKANAALRAQLEPVIAPNK